MSDPLLAISKAASHGLFAQSTRMRVLAENISNSETTGKTPGADPYQRKIITFASTLDEQDGLDLVDAGEIERDSTPFRVEYMPGHPAADAKGYVKMPNVDQLVELADMREANRAYTANTQVLRQVKELVSMTIDLMRSQS